MDYKQIDLDLEEIFSDEFDITCNLASGYKNFLCYTKSSDAVIRHYQRKDKETLIYTFNYLGRKINEPYDPAYEHPHDVGIAVLLNYLIETDYKLYKLSWLYLTKHWKYLSWARRVVCEHEEQTSLNKTNEQMA